MAVYAAEAKARPIERVLVCGGRDFADRQWLYRILDGLHEAHPIGQIIQGGARGADTLAKDWARDRGVSVSTFLAAWKEHGRRAGPLRNQRMLDEGKPDLVVTFPGGRGTADMLRRAKIADVDWMTLSRD